MHYSTSSRTNLALDPAHAQPVVRRFTIQGIAFELTLEVAGLGESVEHLLGEFAVDHVPIGASPLRGHIRLFDEREVLKRLSTSTRRLRSARPGFSRLPFDSIEIFQEDERYWIVDEHWGMAEIDLLKGHWTSWIMPAAAHQPRRCVEAAIQWPLAQLVQRRGIHLLPVVSVARGNIGAICIAPFNLGPELNYCIRAGFKLVGQRWTILRETAGKPATSPRLAEPSFELRQMPGWTDLPQAVSWPRGGMRRSQEHVVDLAALNCGANRARADCNVILVIQSARRPNRRVEPVTRHADASQLLRTAWPLDDIHPALTKSLISRLSRECPVFQLTLSRDPHDLARSLGEVIPTILRQGVTVTLKPTLSPARIDRPAARSA